MVYLNCKMSWNTIYRPTTLDEVAGQEKAKKIVKNLLTGGELHSLIFYGPSGTGKTTIANIIAKESGLKLFKLNGTSFSTSDFKDILQEQETLGKPVLLYLDEIQYLTQKQQQLFLGPIEDGQIILLAATADSPWHKIYKAILSRCTIVEFTSLQINDIVLRLKQILFYIKPTSIFEDKALERIAQISDGDLRNAVNILELTYNQYKEEASITSDMVNELQPSTQPIGFDGVDTHYDMLGCLQKSIRGSDVDASIFYLAKMLNNGMLLDVVRRLQVIASEDIGLASPIAPAIVRACCESALDLGLPEASLPLGHAVALLANSPKSNSSHVAYAKALEDVQAGKGILLPLHLQAPIFKGYKYPHDYKNNWINQQYLPEDIKDTKYYIPGNNKQEQTLAGYWKKIKGE